MRGEQPKVLDKVAGDFGWQEVARVSISVLRDGPLAIREASDAVGLVVQASLCQQRRDVVLVAVAIQKGGAFLRLL